MAKVYVLLEEKDPIVHKQLIKPSQIDDLPIYLQLYLLITHLLMICFAEHMR